MKALIYTGPHEMAYQDAPDPIAASNEVLIKIDSVGICGSDMHAYLGHDERRPAPLILGHEAAGVTTDGARVTVNPLVTCAQCHYCKTGRDNLCPSRQIISMPPREGAFAEWLSMPARNLVSVPDDISLEKAALAEPLACGWHAVRIGKARLEQAAGGSVSEARTLVIGGGAIGVGAALSAAAQGFKNITLIEPNELRRNYIKQKLPFDILHPDQIEPSADFELVIDGVGYEATRALASAKAAPGGVIMHIGLGSATGGVDVRRLTLQEITFIGTYTYNADDFRQTAAAIFSGALGKLDWIEARPLQDGNDAFHDIRSGEVAAPKIILKP